MFKKRMEEIKGYIKDEYYSRINGDIIDLHTAIDAIKSKIDTVDAGISLNGSMARESIKNDIATLSHSLERGIKDLESTEKEIKNLNGEIDNQNKVIQSQQKTINTLVEALCGKFENGLFVYSDDGKVPFVIRNGKVLTNKMTTSFRISWDFSERPNIEIMQDGTTGKYVPIDDEELAYFARKDNNS